MKLTDEAFSAWRHLHQLPSETEKYLQRIRSSPPVRRVRGRSRAGKEIMTTTHFNEIITSEAELRAMMGEPGELAAHKGRTTLDEHCRAFITHAPLLLLGTCGANGSCDVSPRGDGPGFVRVLDEKTLVIPERPGNRRFDSLRNILQTARIGLIFIVPNVEETLRVNGKACLLRDPQLLTQMTAQGKVPALAIGVEVEECFLHCAKAFKRSQLWHPSTWPARTELPSMAQVLLDHARPACQSLSDIEAQIQESYTRRLY